VIGNGQPPRHQVLGISIVSAPFGKVKHAAVTCPPRSHGVGILIVKYTDRARDNGVASEYRARERLALQDRTPRASSARLQLRRF